MSHQPQLFLLLHFNKNHAMAAARSGNVCLRVYQQLEALSMKYEGLDEWVIGELWGMVLQIDWG